MIDEELHRWLAKHGDKRLSYTFLCKVLDEILQPIAASLKSQRDEMSALKAANHGLQERGHLLEARVLELEATAAARGEKVGS